MEIYTKLALFENKNIQNRDFGGAGNTQSEPPMPSSRGQHQSLPSARASIQASPKKGGGFLEAFKQEKSKRESTEAKENVPQEGPTSWLNMRKKMDKSKETIVQPPAQEYGDEDRPIVNNRFKKSQAMNESIQSLPQSSRGHNESRQSMSSGTRRRRSDRRK